MTVEYYVGLKVRGGSVGANGPAHGTGDGETECTFMAVVADTPELSTADLLQRLQQMYPFLAPEGLTDLDGEELETSATEPLLQSWNNYESYRDDRWQDAVPDKMFFLCNASFTGTTPEQLEQLHRLVADQPFSALFNDRLKQWDIPEEYCIKFPSGRKYFMDGHSYDGLHGSNTVVDQLLTSCERYVVTDTGSNRSVELSTQQCILVDTYNPGSPYKPYIMVSKSGLRQLEKLGPLDDLKIRIGHKPEAPAADAGPEPPLGTTRDNARLANSQQQVFGAYSDLVGIFSDVCESRAPVSAEERVLLASLRTELLPVLEEIRGALQEPRSWSPLNGARWMGRQLSRFIAAWIRSGLLFSLLYTLFRYCLKTAWICYLAHIFHLGHNALYLAVALLGLFSTDMLDSLGRVAADTGFAWVARVHLWLSSIRRFAGTRATSAMERIALCCLTRECTGALAIPEHIAKDLTLFVLTSVSPFSKITERLESQTRTAAAGEPHP